MRRHCYNRFVTEWKRIVAVPTFRGDVLRVSPAVGNDSKHVHNFKVAAALFGLGCVFDSSKLHAKEKCEVSVTSNFDSGNIEVIAVKGNEVDLKIRKEPFTEGTDKKSHSQWFYFKAANVRGAECTFRIVNAGECSYAPGFNGYKACVSYDRENWFRTTTEYSDKDGILTIKITPKKDVIWCAYFAPYSYEKHQKLIAKAASASGAQVKSIGKTLDGRDIDLITVGTGKLRAWIQARQHPGETQAEFWVEGFLNRLLDSNDALAKQLRSLCTFYVIPNANPDGSIRGHLRTNAAGANLNREWAPIKGHDAPTLKRSPEVYWILKEMDKVGVDFLLDVHGDEEQPHVFFAATQGNPNWNNRFAKLLQTLAETYQSANPDFGNLAYNYGNDEVGKGGLNYADSQVAVRFNCLAVTLEQPYKDCFDNPEPKCGWSPKRCAKLGASFLDALAAIVHDLRRDFDVDEASLPAWVKPGYECPPTEECSWK